MKTQQEIITEALRSLVKQMYTDLHGSYGAEHYSGEYEEEIQVLAEAISGAKLKVQPDSGAVD